jgi:hypothetical protein
MKVCNDPNHFTVAVVWEDEISGDAGFSVCPLCSMQAALDESEDDLIAAQDAAAEFEVALQKITAERDALKARIATADATY